MCDSMAPHGTTQTKGGVEATPSDQCVGFVRLPSSTVTHCSTPAPPSVSSNCDRKHSPQRYQPDVE